MEWPDDELFSFACKTDQSPWGLNRNSIVGHYNILIWADEKL